MVYQGPYCHHHPEVVNYLPFYPSNNTKTAIKDGSGLRIILLEGCFTSLSRYFIASPLTSSASLPERKGEIIQRYREENALIIYLSDHGDALFDEDYPELMGHALVLRAVEIPLFVYFSPQLRKERPDLWRQISRQRDKRILSDLLTHALVDLLGIHTEYTQPRFNFFAPTYDDRRQHIVVSPTSNKKMVM